MYKLVIGIVFEIFFPVVNGVITTSINLAKNLQKNGHTVYFIAPKWDEFTDPSVEGIPVHYIDSTPAKAYPGIRNVSLFNKNVEKILLDNNTDILHITGPWLLTLNAVKAAKRNNIPVVHTFHTLLYEDQYLYYIFKSNKIVPFIKFFAWKFLELFINKSTVMTAPSQHACSVIKEHSPSCDIRHIRNGVDLDVFSEYEDFESLKKKYSFFNDKTFLFLGRLGEEKSISVLLDAAKKANSVDPDLHLLVIGAGPGADDYKKYVEKNSLQEVIRFLGRMPHDELLHSGIIQHSRVLVTASVTENQPITIIEAIACNTPIIIPDVDGIKELLDGNGMSFPAGDSNALAELMVKLANDDNLYDKCCREGVKIREKFNGENIAAKYEEIYKSLSV